MRDSSAGRGGKVTAGRPLAFMLTGGQVATRSCCHEVTGLARSDASAEAVPIREVAEIFAAHLNVPAVYVTPEQAGEYVGFFGGFWGFDGPASAQITRDLLGWEPTRLGLIADLRRATTSPERPDAALCLARHPPLSRNGL